MKFKMFKNINFFFVILMIILFVEMVFSRYTKGVLTALEKPFNLSSKQLGIFGSAQQIGNLSVLLLVSYFGGKSHRPRILAVGCFLMTIGGLLCVLPHLLVQDYDGVKESKIKLCNHTWSNRSDNESTSPCNLRNERSTSLNYFAIMIFGQIIFGIGMSPLKPLGFSYLDDYVTEKRSAIYLAVLSATFFAGPLFGFMLSAWTTSLYVHLYSSTITPLSSNWVSAWWLGFLVCSIVIFVVGIGFLFFPKEFCLKSVDQNNGRQTIEEDTDIQQQHDSEKNAKCVSEETRILTNEDKQDDAIGNQQSWSDNPWFGGSHVTKQNSDDQLNGVDQQCCISLKQLLSDRFYMLTVSISVCLWFYSSGFTVFVIKYVENQFSLSTPNANIYFGLIPTPFVVLGTLFAGVIISRWEFSTAGIFRFLFLIVTLGIVSHCIGFFSSGCDTSSTTPSNIGCRPEECQCDDTYQPVCGGEVTFASACLAGCTDFQLNRQSKTLNFTSCSCSPTNYATPGRCAGQCLELKTLFMVISCFGSFLFGCMCSPSFILIMRIVKKSNKSFGLGITLVCNKLLGAIPGPLIAGKVIDQTCRLKVSSCSRVCAMYDLREFRVNFGILLLVAKIVTFILISVAVILSRKEPTIRKSAESEGPQRL